MMVVLCNWIWKNEYAAKRWRETVVGNLFKKGDEADPGNIPRHDANKHGQTFCMISNDRNWNDVEGQKNKRTASRI